MSLLKLIFIVIFIIPENHTKAGINRNDLFELSVVHMNDFHARFDETNDSAGTCKKGVKCIGGFSRLYREIQNILEYKPDSVVLNAGDNFAGTLWYNVGKWNITQQFMNKIPFAASVLGNHEFEDGIDGLVPYIKALHHPTVIANMDDSLEPTMQGLCNKSIVIEKNGKKIGIIGVLVSTVSKIADIGKLKFSLESPSINAEAERLVREEGVFTNIVLSHSGYDIDQQIAANASEKISLIVGGHTHTFLYTGDNPPGPDEVGGPYPTIVESPHGHKVLIVQASSYCRYLGNIIIYLDRNGEVADYSGSPIFLSNDFPQDEKINEELKPWRDLVNAVDNPVIGSTLVTLNKWKCSYEESTLGNFVADSMVYAHTKNTAEGTWTNASISICDCEGLRTNLDIGDITQDDLNTSLPYDNTFDVGEIKGSKLKDLFEYNTILNSGGKVTLRLLQVSGINLVYNLTRPEGDRIQSIKIRCQNCTIPIYEDLDPDQTYKIIVESFVVAGGNNYSVIVDNLKNVVVGPLNKVVNRDFLKHRSPVFQEVGLKIVYNLTRPEGQRVQSVKVRCQDCTIPKYEDLQLDQTYRIVVASFIIAGGNNYSVIVNDLKNVVVGPFSRDVYQDYLNHRSPIYEEVEERIVIFND